MYPVSADFKSQIRQSHQAIVKAEVWSGDTRLLTLDALDGSVDVDARRGVRRTCTVRIAAPDPSITYDRETQTYAELSQDYSTYTALASTFVSYGQILTGDLFPVEVDAGVVPDTPFSALAPYGNEIRLWRGIRVNRIVSDETTYGELGATYSTYAAVAASVAAYGALNVTTQVEVQEDEYVPLGVFLITDVEVTSGNGGTTLQIQGSDRALRISRARWTQPYTVPSSTNAAIAIADLLADRWSNVETSFSDTDDTLHRAVFGLESENDPWKDARKLSEAAGLDLYFDPDGIARLDPVQDFETATPDASYVEDAEAMILDLTRKLTNETTYNGVIATGEGSEASATFRGEVWDDDPESPTYRYGLFGEVPTFYSSPLLTSDEQATKAATTILARKRGTQEAVSWSQIVDPSLDVGDVIRVVNAATKVDRVMVLDRLSIPLSPNQAMSAVARTVRSLNGTGFEEADVA
jgi:hypothetical protein